MADDVPGSTANGNKKQGYQASSAPGSPNAPGSPTRGSSSPMIGERRPHGFTGRLTGRLSRMMSGLPSAQPANEYTAMQVGIACG